MSEPRKLTFMVHEALAHLDRNGFRANATYIVSKLLDCNNAEAEKYIDEVAIPDYKETMYQSYERLQRMLQEVD